MPDPKTIRLRADRPVDLIAELGLAPGVVTIRNTSPHHLQGAFVAHRSVEVDLADGDSVAALVADGAPLHAARSWQGDVGSGSYLYAWTRGSDLWDWASLAVLNTPAEPAPAAEPEAEEAPAEPEAPAEEEADDAD